MTLSASGMNLLRQFGVFVVITAFSVGLVAAHAHQDKRLSVMDELAHVDSLFRAAAGGIARPGDQIGLEARREAACRGIDTQPPPPSCQPLSEPAAHIGSTVAQGPPVYYYATYWLAQALRTTGIAKDLVTAGRLADGVWLGAGLFLLWLVALELGASLIARVGITALIGANGGVLYMSAIVNPNATAIAGGAAVLLSTLLWERRRLTLAFPGLAAAAAILFESDAVLSILALCIYLLARAWTNDNARQRARRAYVLAASTLASAALTSEVVWIMVRSLVVRSWPFTNLVVPHGLDQLARQIGALVTPLSFTPVSPPTFHSWPAYLASVLVIGASIGAVLYLRGLDRLRSLGLASMLVLVLGGPFVFMTMFVVQRINGDVPLWYGFSLIPGLGAVAAAAVSRSRVGLVALLLTATVTLWVQAAYLHGPLV